MAKNRVSRIGALVLMTTGMLPLAAQAQNRPAQRPAMAISGAPAARPAEAPKTNADGTPHDPFWRLRQRQQSSTPVAKDAAPVASTGPRTNIPVLGGNATASAPPPTLTSFKVMN